MKARKYKGSPLELPQSVIDQENELWETSDIDPELVKRLIKDRVQSKGTIIIFGTGGAIKGDSMKDWYK